MARDHILARAGGSAAISFSPAPNMQHNYSIDNSAGKWSQPIAELQFNGLDGETREEWRKEAVRGQCVGVCGCVLVCVCEREGGCIRGGKQQGPFIRNENMFRP